MFSNMSMFLPVESCEEWTFSEQLHCTLMFNMLGQGRTFWMEVYPWYFDLLKILNLSMCLFGRIDRLQLVSCFLDNIL